MFDDIVDRFLENQKDFAAQIGSGGVIPGANGPTDGAPVVATSITGLAIQ